MRHPENGMAAQKDSRSETPRGMAAERNSGSEMSGSGWNVGGQNSGCEASG